MAIKTLYSPYQGLKSALMTLPSTGKKGVLAFTTDTNEFYFDTGSGVGIGSAWLPLLGGGGGPVTSVNGQTGAVLIVGGTAISVAVVGGNIVVTNTQIVPTLVPAETPLDSGDHQNFTLANSPSPALGLMLFENGQLLNQGAGLDYTLTGNAIALAAPIDVSGPDPDVLIAFYWM